MIDDIDNVKTVKDCVEMATMDAYVEEEQIEGWCACLEDVLSNTRKVLLLGNEVLLKGIKSDRSRTVVAVCERNKQKVKVTLDSIELIKPTKAQALWLKAWNSWSV